MDIEAIKAHALATKEKAVSLALQGEHLSVYDVIQAERARVCKTDEERAAWDKAFLAK